MTLRILIAAILSLVLVGAAHAQPYPNKPIRWVIPYPPGGGVDAVGRIVGEKLGEVLGVPVVVTHLPGGNGIVGSDSVRRAAADGYTLMFNASVFIMGPQVMKSVPYDPITDFSPIAQIGDVPLLVISTPKVAATSLSELSAKIKDAPDQFNVAISSPGAAGHLGTLAFLHHLGAKVEQIPYRGTGLGLTDVISGNVQLMVEGMTVLLPQVKAGRVRAYAVTSKQRSKLAPEIPATAEAGIPDLVISSWYGVWGPPGLPDDIVRHLATAIEKTAASPDLISRFESLGLTTTFMKEADFQKFVKQESEQGKRLLRGAGFEPQ
ncbi:tripartite tricarboxylate transporter substrate binding protein [Bradyrhizobium sp. LHD-71]|uniref:Bug family tripartite tricarboxylate transporter substrate binding protein n=1 Tax=Bradyrhizobium sp. LHD-71 TaxID=3072141 RepID=UPI00280E478F|nr:tripartite tricarboxylate transporter substrate binding protein [Bradyrhizobium sp. LHD-71]MDQ8732323.1 tripartite tricarboxylate transporter substrate binding protein [Bradyrhizobium sp. LHD-71]